MKASQWRGRLLVNPYSRTMQSTKSGPNALLNRGSLSRKEQNAPVRNRRSFRHRPPRCSTRQAARMCTNLGTLQYRHISTVLQAKADRGEQTKVICVARPVGDVVVILDCPGQRQMYVLQCLGGGVSGGKRFFRKQREAHCRVHRGADAKRRSRWHRYGAARAERADQCWCVVGAACAEGTCRGSNDGR